MSAQGSLRDREPAGFELIETLRWEPQAGFLRLDRHLARLSGSATELGFTCDRSRLTTALDRAVRGAQGPLRMRLQLAQNGEAEITTQPFQPLPTGATWRLRLARTTLSSSDGLLRHKTTRRQTYAKARAEYLASEAEEVLLANERGEICEGSITTLFADFGDVALSTPRLDCGLLAGILRAEMLAEGRAREAVLSLDDLHGAKALFVGNSLRGLVPARLVVDRP